MSETPVIPTHLGLILDGNRRWAKAKGLPALEGHRQGSEVFKEIALEAFSRGVQYVSAFVFSTENWSRTEEEVGYLMKLVLKATEKYLEEFDKAGIKIVILGRRNNLPEDVLKSLEQTEAKTKDNTQGTLALCFNYGGQEELVDAVRYLIASGPTPKAINADVIHSALYCPEIPNLDLLIRTSGEHRISGFMLYRAAYAELMFVDKLWPDFTKNDLTAALEQYATRERRFGQ
jgi:undecaprenyl diphosphate synthase